jgi:hypothetical protein
VNGDSSINNNFSYLIFGHLLCASASLRENLSSQPRAKPPSRQGYSGRLISGSYLFIFFAPLRLCARIHLFRHRAKPPRRQGYSGRLVSGSYLLIFFSPLRLCARNLYSHPYAKPLRRQGYSSKLVSGFRLFALLRE